MIPVSHMESASHMNLCFACQIRNANLLHAQITAIYFVRHDLATMVRPIIFAIFGLTVKSLHAKKQMMKKTAPTAKPTAAPTRAPTRAPTKARTSKPTNVPPTDSPAAPSDTPVAPSDTPVAVATPPPSAGPTAALTKAPTAGPTTAPTNVPTAGPTAAPTQAPTAGPTAAPTKAPTTDPKQIACDFLNRPNLEDCLLKTSFDGSTKGSTIPSQLGLLTQLTYLNLNFNNLTSAIPSEIGRLTQLTYLDVSDNGLIGTIPSSLCQLSSPKPEIYVDCGEVTCAPGCCRSGATTLVCVP